MKKINLLLFVLSISVLTLLTESCKKAEEILDPCASVSCQNDGTCNDGTCACPEGFTGTTCESFDPAFVQALLDDGKTPGELLAGGITLKQLYGKTYEGGLIFSYNEADGSGMVAALMDAPSQLNWQAAVDYCNSLVNGEKDDWFLPSIEQLDMMWTNLADSDGNFNNEGPDDENNLGGFAADLYWSSTENDNFNAWYQYFDVGNQNLNVKDLSLPVRAARAF